MAVFRVRFPCWVRLPKILTPQITAKTRLQIETEPSGPGERGSARCGIDFFKYPARGAALDKTLHFFAANIIQAATVLPGYFQKGPFELGRNL